MPLIVASRVEKKLRKVGGSVSQPKSQDRVAFSTQQMTVFIKHLKVFDSTLKRLHGLRISEYCILRTLQLAETVVSASDLVAYTCFSKSTVTEALLLLEDKYLVVKFDSRDDRRKMLVKCTESGCSLSRAASKSLYHALRSTFWKAMPDDEIAEVLSHHGHDHLFGERPDSLAVLQQDDIPLTASFLFSIIIIVRQWGVLIREQCELSMSEFRILSVLDDARAPLRLIDISEKLSLKKSNAFNEKMQLEKKGLVKSEKTAAVVRGRNLTLTPKGKKLVDKLKGLLDEMNQKLYYTTDRESSLLNAWHMRMYFELATTHSD